MPEIVDNTQVLTDLCSMCGEAISSEEIGLEFWGNFVCYLPNRKGRGIIDFVVCLKCANYFIEVQDQVAEGNIETGVQKRSNRFDQYR